MDDRTYIQWLNIPKIPDDLLDRLPRDFNMYEKLTSYENVFYRSDSFIDEIRAWCETNVSDTVNWGFQIITGDAPKHRDLRVNVKFHYVIETGGQQVYTHFWKEDGSNIKKSIMIPRNKWHILKVDELHSVQGITDGMTRFSLTGKIF